MARDEQFTKAIEGGERNAEMLTLMKNWCAHARAKRFGGIGMVEQATGLPIGHFSMECDHAPMGGMASWDLGESMLDFYDRNCASCTLRTPVGFPNLSELVIERDQRRKAAAARERLEKDEIERAYKERAVARARVRKDVDAINQALVDDLDSFDREHCQVDRQRLVEAARMAPERIDPKLVDLLFEQAAATTSLALLTLEMGAAVVPGERRLLLLAQRLFRNGLGGDTAPAILIAHLDLLKDGDVTDLVPAAAELARPDHRMFGGDYESRIDPRLLIAMWDQRPEAVRAGIDRLLDGKTTNLSQLAGRAMALILGHDASAASIFFRSAASRYVRAHQVLPDLGEYENLGDIAHALDLIFSLEPDKVDAVLQELKAGGDIEAKRNIAQLYSNALWRSRFSDEQDKPLPEARLRVAITRLIWLPGEMFDHEVMATVANAFRHPPEEARLIIKEYADQLVGAALLLDERVAETERRQGDQLSWLQQLEWSNLRSGAYRVAEEFLEAAAANSDDPQTRAKFIAAIKAIPEERAVLRGITIEAAMRIASDVEGLNAVLPLLYSGLVGADVLGRAYAATAISKLPSCGRQNLPPLVFEAFTVLLLDQYVAVHKSAVRALKRISPPDDLKPRVAFALFNLVSTYSETTSDDNFLMDCIDQLARFAEHGPTPARMLDFLCLATVKVQPLYVRSELRGLRHKLAKSDEFALVVAHVLPEHAGDLNNHRDDDAALIGAMSTASILKHKARLAEVAKEVMRISPWHAMLIADVLYRAGARAESTALLEQLTCEFGATVKDKSHALFVAFPLLAMKMEQALADGDDTAWAALAQEWDERMKEQKALIEDRRARDSRSRFSIPD